MSWGFRLSDGRIVIHRYRLTGRFQPLRLFPYSFNTGKGDSMVRMRRYPVTDRTVFSRVCVRIEPQEQARGFRLDRFPTAPLRPLHVPDPFLHVAPMRA